ncbi:MAG TPA: hypothetical protein VF941_11520 [Clostridia bacterium]
MNIVDTGYNWAMNASLEIRAEKFTDSQVFTIVIPKDLNIDIIMFIIFLKSIRQFFKFISSSFEYKL